MNRSFKKPSKSKRAVSAVISNMILIAAVISVGFVVLAWAQSQSSIYNNQYSTAIRSDTDQLRERMVFEYIYYNGTATSTGAHTLTVYLMNSGTIGDVSIANAYVDNIPYGAQVLKLTNDTTKTIDSLDIGEEGCFSIDLTGLASGNHAIMIVTRRGSSFVATFAT